MFLEVRMVFQYHDLSFERFQSLEMGFVLEFLPNLWGQIWPIRYLEESVEGISSVQSCSDKTILIFRSTAISYLRFAIVATTSRLSRSLTRIDI